MRWHFVSDLVRRAAWVVTIGLSISGRAEWVAFLDHMRGPETSNRVTVVNLAADSGGVLTNVLDGQALAAGFTVVRTGTVNPGGVMARPDPGTPADQTFGGWIDFTNSPSGNNAALVYSVGSCTLTFTNLDPAKRYRLAATTARGGNYTLRWTVCVIQSADAFVDAHTSGCITNGDPRVPAGTMTNGQAAFNSGHNLEGDMVQWDQIQPGPDGQFAIEMRHWRGAIPGGTAGDTYAYALSALRLEELVADSPPLIRTPLENQTNVVGATVTFTVGASGTPPLTYFWFSNDVFLLTTGTGSFTSAPLVEGSNFLCTVIVSNALGMATNSASAWGVAPAPPLVTLVMPTNNQPMTVPATLLLQAAVSNGPLGSVTGVGFFSTNHGWLASAFSSPYSNGVTLLATNIYAIYAVATNSFGLTAFSATNLVFVSGQTIDLTAGLVGHWTLNDGTGSLAADSSGYGDHGGLHNGPTWTAGKLGGGLRLDGANDEVAVADAPALNPSTGLTLAAWVNSANIQAGGMILSKGASGIQYHLRLFSGSLRFRLNLNGSTTGYEPAYTFSNGVWYHLAATYDGAALRLYVNGALIGTPQARTGTITPDSVGLSLGKRSGSSINYFNGTLDDVRIYNRALSAAEITTLAGLSDDRSWDFGDAPDPAFPTRAAANGPRHSVGTLFLGNRIDPESDARPDAQAEGDDTDSRGDDEDGVVFLTPISPGDEAGLTVTASLAGRLDAWLDFNGNGTWAEAGEQIFTNVPLTAGANTLSFSVPTNATLGPAFARFRFSSAGGLAPTGPANDGEVEDYTVQITAPVTNTVPPTIAAVVPPPGASLGSLTQIQVTFSEAVVNVEAADLLVNGVPATALAGSGSNYTFTVVSPPYGPVLVSWATGHGIVDRGRPPLPFDENGPNATWSYTLVDTTPPVVVGQNPPAGATLTNLAQIEVTFSEAVTNVDAADLLINSAPAIGLSGSGTTYTFAFTQPVPGTVNIGWAKQHGITDLAGNAFDDTGPGATWTYSLELPRVRLVATNSTWRYFKGLSEASTPSTAWRAPDFDDRAWPEGPAAFYYGTDPYTGTLLSDMLGAYTCVFLRQAFVVAAPATLTNVLLRLQADDGCIAWINGIEVARVRAAPGEIPFNGTSSANANEYPQGGAVWVDVPLTDPQSFLVPGTNVLAIQALNASLAGSSDFGIDAELIAEIADPALLPPTVLSVSPPAGPVFELTNLTVTFTKPVLNVEASDLLVNGVPATGLTGGEAVYTFAFAQPPYGPVAITWATNHGITDTNAVPRPFDATAPGATWQYTLLNPSAPLVAAQIPVAGATVSALTQIQITFSEPVSGVDAADLLINGLPATGLSGSNASYTFTFPQPAYGNVSVTWAASHGITDVEVPPNAFDPTRPSSTWSYTLVDQTPPAVAGQSPPAGASVTNLTQITVTFTEPVSGVEAADLLVNGVPATGLSGGPTTYTFTFPRPNASVITVSWVTSHGIRDLAPAQNAFNATAPGSTWSYTTPDTVPPALVAISPPAHATVRSLTRITVSFNEPVSGVDAADLLLNNVPATSVSGAGAGPYLFQFAPPSNGLVEVQWAPGHGIADLATPPNPFGGGEWTYTLDPNASFADKVLISEIMFNPPDGAVSNEWIELHNVATEPVNLAGWRFTRGVEFTFPNVSIEPDGYLVVAADLAAFLARYPGVTNVVGGWSGRLANNDETLRLETALGEVVNTVHYASEGDWARRERGHGARLVTRITRSGSTATVTIFDHGYTATDQVMISGADQPEYNGRFTISGLGPSTFNITVPGAPASPATGPIVCRQVLDNGFTGWSWFCAADGLGSSLELVNPALPNDVGQNWLSSAVSLGTPGAPNSVARSNVAPLLLNVTHFPPVPRSTDPVAITARVRDELSNGVQSVTLFYRNHTANYGANPPPFLSTPMFDSGTNGDGVAGDGLYGAILPAAPNGTVVEFYVQATDTSGLSRTWPAPAWDTNNTFGQLANALYQVDDETITAPMPALRLVMTGTERALFPPSDRNSDAEMNATLISTDADGTRVRYNCGVRVRGAGTRGRTPTNNRLNIPNDRRWNGLAAVNLNCQFIHAALAGNVLAQKSGVLAADARAIQYRINGVNPAPITPPVNQSGNGAGWGTFLLVEPVNGDLAADWFPNDGDGNVYRASTGNHNANLTYYGTDANAYVSTFAHGYFKTSNQTENDWTDLINLCFALSQIANDTDYVRAIQTNLNVVEWMRYFALGSLLNYGETSLFNGRGDDYALYRGLNDPRFQLIGHDFDTVLGEGDTGSGYYPINTNSSIFIMINPPNPNANVPVLRRFLTHPAFAPIFHGELKRLCDTVFQPAQLDPLLDQLLGGWGVGPDATTLTRMKNYAGCRRLNVLAQIPLTLTVNHTLPTQNGYPTTTTPAVTLFGSAHAVDTRSVLVNGSTATWSAWDARWTNTVSLQPGLNRVLVQSLNSNNVEFARARVDIWYNDGSVQNVSGTITTDTAWDAAGGPYQITADLTVNPGVTLTIAPGTTVYLGPGVNLIVANGGRLLAEGTETAPIRFTRAPGSASTWGGVTINGGAGSPETRIAHAHIEFNGTTAIHVAGGTVFLDHLTFGNTAGQYLSLDGASFVVQDCVFPSATAGFELVHGNQGIKSGGRGLFLRNFFGAATGYNDVVDFTGGNRPGPILQFINNVFVGSGDDLLDLDGTDAWIEGNVFLHAHKNGSPDTASAVSGGNDASRTSEITILGNLIYDCDHTAMAKGGNFFTLLNNTIVRQTRQGGTDTDAAVVALADENFAEGAGMYLEGNIIFDAEKLTRFHTNAAVTFTNNLIAGLQGPPWTGPGGNNPTNDPLFQYVPSVAETTNFTSWAAAQVLWDWFRPKTGSPATGAGPNGRDLGAVNLKSPISNLKSHRGVSISGEPASPTRRTDATLTVGPNRAGNGIPAAGWPAGSGFTHYRWRLDGGPWSAETPITTPISLSGLAVGSHVVEVVGRNDAGWDQDDPALGPDAVVTVARAWVVNPTAPALRLNEVLAANRGAVNHYGTTPDLIELYNPNGTAVDLAGVRLTDDPQAPDKFIFPPGASLGAGEYLVVFANDPDGTPGYHLGFNLNQEGESLYLYDAPANGGALLDSLTFGPQLPDLSVGRLADGTWALTWPTFGAGNRPAPLGDPARLRLNEWLAVGQAPFDTDFIELYNGDPLPVDLGGLFLSDEIIGWPTRHALAPLSFIAGQGYLRFLADADPAQGALHLNFRLDYEQGAIGLFGPDLTPIDCVFYQPQRQNISQGRSPNGGSAIVFFDIPTPGAPNPVVTGPPPFGGALVINEVLANNASLTEGGRTPDWVELYNGTTNTIDLSGLGLTDDTLQPQRFVFPPGTVLPAGGFLRVLCDPGNTNPGPLVNTNFALKSTGGGVWLFQPPSNLVTWITYGLQTPDLSIGRVPDGSTNWVLTSPTPQAPNAAVPTLGSVTNLKVNEWMADPGPGKDDWFEIYNAGPLPVALGGLWLTDNLNDRLKHPIAPLSFIGTGTNAFIQFRADGNTGAGADHVSFSLRAAREDVGISAPDGTLLDGYAFTQQQEGVSEGRFPDGSPNVVRFPGTASPGESNYRLLTNVVINEVLTHTDPPFEDAIELRNLSDQDIDLSGWWLSDDPGTLQKYPIPSPTVLPANGFVVFYESAFSNRDLAAMPFSLSSKGDEVVLAAATNGALTGWRAKVKFGAAESGVSFGRHVTSVGKEVFVAMSDRTFGADDPVSTEEFRTGTGRPNAYPKVGPVGISEIMYHPPDLGTNDNTRDEFIELHNLTTVPVTLFDPAYPTNTWRLRGGVDFDFPTNLVLPAGGFLLVVGFDPALDPAALAAFRGAYGLGSNVLILGPWRGKLDNGGEAVELKKPDAPDADEVPFILVEQIEYDDVAPWPTGADGTGLSLQRLDGALFGDDPAHWLALIPSPGAASPADADGDGMPNTWETSYGLNPNDPFDAHLDADADGQTNLQEFQAGTDPRNPLSVLRLALIVSGTNSLLQFTAVAHHSYTVEFTDSLAGGAWQPIRHFDAAPGDRLVELPVTPPSSQGFYRVRTPRVP